MRTGQIILRLAGLQRLYAVTVPLSSALILGTQAQT